MDSSLWSVAGRVVDELVAPWVVSFLWVFLLWEARDALVVLEGDVPVVIHAHLPSVMIAMAFFCA